MDGSYALFILAGLAAGAGIFISTTTGQWSTGVYSLGAAVALAAGGVVLAVTRKRA